MKILFCASECAPFAKTGGLADVMGALPKALKEKNCDARVIMPYYKKIKEKNIAEYKGYAYVKIAERMEYVGLFHTVHEEIDFYFIDSDRYFNRDGLYGYGDDGERFAYFDFAILEALKVINFFPDVIHLNDWQTGLIPYILKSNYHFYSEYNRIKTVYSIHNIQYQGNFPMDMMRILFMPYASSLEFDGCINFMKAGILESNIVTTVSETYKNEVLTDYYGYRLNNILGLRYFDFYGIVNGIDVIKYDPSSDKNIYTNYTIKTVKTGKKQNKEALLKEFGLSLEDVPLFGLVSRLVDQKGIDLLMPILDDVIQYSNAKFILMGSGDSYYENFFRTMEAKYPDRFKCYIGYSDPVAQKIYAGCDIFLMPSKFEPCGLGQMIAMRYGTLPLVRETGGLKDTVLPYNEYTNEGTGFSFTNYNATELKDVMFLALNTYNNNKDAWSSLVKQAMEKDYSWSSSAAKYLDIYKKNNAILGGKNMETLALILAGGRGSRLDILSEKRSKPAVPFAGKFRIIDFALSNCCNSGIFQIGILTQYLPLSLNEHIGVGKPWDLDRRDSFVTLLQPNNSWYEGTADAIRKNLEFVKRYASKYVLILSGDHVYKMDYSKMIDQHKQTGADLTIAAKIVPMEEADRFGILETDSNLKINKFVEKPKEPKSNKASMGIYVFSTQALIEAIEAHPDIVDLDFGKHIIPDMINNKRVYAYEFYDYWKDVGTYDSYLETNLELIEDTALDLYDPSWKIYTKSEDLPPVKVGVNAEIKRSLISNGCQIDGTINHSVISPGVKVGEGSIITNSVILNDVVIGKNCHIENSIIDKETIVGDNSIIGTGKDYQPNKDKPKILSSGINVIGKKLILPESLIVERNVRIFSSTNVKNVSEKHITSGETLS